MLPAPELETARLRLRGFVPEDLDALFTIYRDPEVMKYIGDGRGKSREETATRLAAMIQQWQEHDFGRWAVIDKASGDLIGRCGLSFLDDTPEVELGYVLAKPYWGRGLITEASRGCLKFGFEEAKLQRIVAIAQPANVASYRVMEKVGMKFERMAHFYKTEVVYYALAREAYLAQCRHHSLA